MSEAGRLFEGRMGSAKLGLCRLEAVWGWEWLRWDLFVRSEGSGAALGALGTVGVS